MSVDNGFVLGLAARQASFTCRNSVVMDFATAASIKVERCATKLS